jgi:hypothetical protein
MTWNKQEREVKKLKNIAVESRKETKEENKSI